MSDLGRLKKYLKQMMVTSKYFPYSNVAFETGVLSATFLITAIISKVSTWT